jgi:hypothetical protein
MLELYIVMFFEIQCKVHPSNTLGNFYVGLIYIFMFIYNFDSFWTSSRALSSRRLFRNITIANEVIEALKLIT